MAFLCMVYNQKERERKDESSCSGLGNSTISRTISRIVDAVRLIVNVISSHYNVTDSLNAVLCLEPSNFMAYD